MADASVTIRGGAGNATQIQSRAVDAAAPSDGQALAWSNSDSEWEPTTISAGSSEWTDTGSVLHPTESTVDNVVVGGTTTGNSDIVLGVDGSALFNDQSGTVDFNVKSANQAKMLHVDGTNDTVGVGCDPVEAGANNPSALLFVSNRGTPSTPAQYSSLIVENAAAAAYINVISNDGGQVGMVMGDASDPDEASINYGTVNKRMYFTGNAEGNANATVVIDTSANAVGFNVVAPTNAVDVDGNIGVKGVAAGSEPALQTGYSKIYSVLDGQSADANTLLLIRSDGANGSNTFIDDSPSPKTVTAVGHAQIDDSVKKFGLGSLLLDGTGDYLTVADNAAWDFGTGDFTIEAWLKTGTSITSTRAMIVGRTTASGGGWGDLDWVMTLDSNDKLFFQASDSGGSGVSLTGTTSIADDSWHHCAVVRNGNDFDVYVDGTSEANTTSAITINATSNPVTVGWGYANDKYITGNIDEVRVSNIARWTANFTPQTTAYAGKAELYCMDEAGNRTRLSSHNEEAEWEYYSKSPTGRVVRINMERAIKVLERLSGETLIENV